MHPVDQSGKIHLNTELKIGIDEFEAYDIPLPPVTIAHHLREFNVSAPVISYIIC